jgi:AraC-like DNA-binding protein
MFTAHKNEPFYQLPPDLSDQLDRLFKIMHNESISNNYGSTAVITCNTLNMLLLIKRSGMEKISNIKLGAAQLITLDIMQYISVNLTDFSLVKLSESMHMSKYYLCHCFKNTTGITISYYLKERRLSKVRQLLAETDLAISEIAMQLGYSSFSLMCQTFKKRSGKTPREYRNLINTHPVI